MHPNPLFRWEDRGEMRDFIDEVGFGALFAATPYGPRVAHVPVVWLGEDALGLHLSRGNGIARHLDGASALFTAIGPDAYVSPDWYGEGTQEVPTWNYVAVELEGTIRRMDRDALLAQIEALSHANEARLAPKPEWTVAKVDPLRLEQMLGAITGFRLEVQAWRGTRKLGQNKSDAARLSAADALDAQGRRAVARWMRHPG
jgi:transcriptional regulator